jgi:inner membrane protein
VDWITHAALGALIVELMLGKRLGKRAPAWGALLGIFPELDIIIFPLLDTARQLEWHHGPSHSLWIMALGSYALSHGLAKIWKKQQITKAQAGWCVFVVWCGHLFADCLTAEGFSLLWPISDKRVAFNCFYPGDFLFTLPLVVSVLRLAFLKEELQKKPRGKNPPPSTKRRNLCFQGLALSLGLALLAAGMSFIAARGFDADLARRGTKYERRIQVPTSYNFLFWRAVVDRGGEMWVGYRSVFESQEESVRWTVYLKGTEALDKVRELRETKTLLAYTDGWWIARPNAKGAWLGDLRFPESRTWGSKKGMVDSRLASSWVIHLNADGDHLRETFPTDEDPLDYLQRMVERICGNSEAWEANPRLAGVAGSLPEFLPVEE